MLRMADNPSGTITSSSPKIQTYFPAACLKHCSKFPSGPILTSFRIKRNFSPVRQKLSRIEDVSSVEALSEISNSTEFWPASCGANISSNRLKHPLRLYVGMASVRRGEGGRSD